MHSKLYHKEHSPDDSSKIEGFKELAWASLFRANIDLRSKEGFRRDRAHVFILLFHCEYESL